MKEISFSFPSKDVVVDQSNLYQIQNEYDEKGEIIESFASTYKQVGEQLIPEMNLVSRYSPLSNGQRLQTSSIKQYLSYTIKVNDQLVFRVGKGDCNCIIPEFNEEVDYPDVTLNQCNSHTGICFFTPTGVTSQTTTVSFNEKPSDGVVLVESASYMTGENAETFESKPFVEDSPVNTGSSHMQARNDRNLKRSLVEIFEGKHGGFFATDKRD